MDASYLPEFCGYWREGYNWRNAEQKLNQLAHYRTEIDEIGIHFVYECGKGPAPFPLILTYGYPDSFYRYAPRDRSRQMSILFYRAYPSSAGLVDCWARALLKNIKPMKSAPLSESISVL
jgi:hypothetical protein